MKQEGNSSVAWFKLSELIARGEKEKALNLYRLLSHSFEEKAYSLQLEGDILWSFSDELAIDKYNQAALLYKKSNKVTAAIAIYEHLMTLQPKQHEHLANVTVLYARLKWTGMFKESFDIILDLFENNDVSLELMHKTVEEVASALSNDSFDGPNAGDSFKTFSNLLKERAPDIAKKTKGLTL